MHKQNFTLNTVTGATVRGTLVEGGIAYEIETVQAGRVVSTVRHTVTATQALLAGFASAHRG
ncbi:hypothetical protein ACFPA8_07780 [Streptomyces ovatisporus]|uniref:Uncharacterized protein n=1 Tax=Streptomyces ovatisporus TaxID=1128682 RepID=A0ABV9A5Q1_9ACTN